MKTRPILATLTSAFALAAAPSHASTVTQTDPSPGGVGVPYFWTVTLGGIDSGTASSHVGAWSWEDDSLFDSGAGEPPVGWTHTSNWVALILQQPSIFTFRLERQEGVPWPSGSNPNRVASTDFMFPSFTLWANQDNDDADFHMYNNRGNVDWAEDLSYLDHYDNSTLTAVQRSYTLPAGEYTIAIGSNAPSTSTNRQGYLATFTTEQVPEPTTGTLLLASLTAFGARRRKSVSQ